MCMVETNSGYVQGPGVDDPTISDDQQHRHIEPKSKEKDALNFPCCHLLGLTWESRHLVVVDAAERLHSV
jgi:hypothetical protein